MKRKRTPEEQAWIDDYWSRPEPFAIDGCRRQAPTRQEHDRAIQLQNTTREPFDWSYFYKESIPMAIGVIFASIILAAISIGLGIVLVVVLRALGVG